MARKAKASATNRGPAKIADSATLGLEAKLWQAADALRNNMDAAEYTRVVLRLIFLKYISDAFEAKHAELDAQRKQGAEPEDPDEYRAVNIFWVPPEARWAYLKSMAPQPTIGQLVDDAMSAIERDNVYVSRPTSDRHRAAQIRNEAGYFGQNEPKIPDRMPALIAEVRLSSQDERKCADVDLRQ